MDEDDEKKKPPFQHQFEQALYQYQFTQEELERLREMLLERERVKWLWGTVGVYIRWLGFIGGSVVAAKLLLGDARELLLKWMK